MMSGRTTNIDDYVNRKGRYAHSDPPNAHRYPPRVPETARQQPETMPEAARQHQFLLRVAYNATTGIFYASPQSGVVYTGRTIDDLARELAGSQQIPEYFAAVPGYVRSKKPRGRGTVRIRGAEPAEQFEHALDFALPRLIADYRAETVRDNWRAAEEGAEKSRHNRMAEYDRRQAEEKPKRGSETSGDGIRWSALTERLPPSWWTE